MHCDSRGEYDFGTTCFLKLLERIDKNRLFPQSGNMKTTVDLPEQLIREVTTLAVSEQRQLDEIVAELVRAGIDSRKGLVSQGMQKPTAQEWLDEWVKLGEETLHDAPPSPTATEILDADRNRLERGE